MKILFLDIDGVLNGHEWDDEAKSCSIRRECVKHLNRVLNEANCSLVLSSAWRYMIHCGAMTLDGFWYMLRTHGLTNRGRGNPFVGLTCKDEHVDPRGQQIHKWIGDARKGGKVIDSWAVVDDDPMQMELAVRERWRLVRTDCATGLIETDADRLIEILNRKGNPC